MKCAQFSAKSPLVTHRVVSTRYEKILGAGGKLPDRGRKEEKKRGHGSRPGQRDETERIEREERQRVQHRPALFDEVLPAQQQKARIGTCTPNAVGTIFEVIVLLQMSLFLLTKLDFCLGECLQKRLCDSCHLQTFGGISVFFSAGKPSMSIKFLVFGGGILGSGGGGGILGFIFGRGDFLTQPGENAVW